MRVLTLLVAFCLLAADAAAGPAPLKARRLGAAATSYEIGADRTRFAGWPTADRSGMVVFDADRGDLLVYPNPAGCTAPVVGVDAMVYTCEGARPGIGTARLLDLRTGAVRQVVGDDPSENGSGFTPFRVFVAAGTRWIQAAYSDYHYSATRFYSRATGEEYAGPTPFGPHVRPDLDRPALRTAICSPLVAPSLDDSDNADGYSVPHVDGRFLLDEVSAGPRGQTNLVLRQCGTRRARVVCRALCFSPVLDRGQVFWADDFGVLHVLAVHARRARTYVIEHHPINTIHVLRDKLVLATDQLAGETRAQVRVTARPGAARAPRTR